MIPTAVQITLVTLASLGPAPAIAPAPTSTAAPEPVDALMVLIEGRRALASGDLEAAVERFRAASSLDPTSPLVAHELAVALLRAGQAEAARAEIERARHLGEIDPELPVLEAMVLSQLGQDDQAAQVVASTDTWEGDLMAAALGDGAAASRATSWVRESSRRGALTALVLSAHAGAHGDRTTARNLAALSEQVALHSQASDVAAAAADLGQRLRAADDWIRAGAWLRSSFDYATNPLFSSVSRRRPLALRLGLSAEAAAQAPIGLARIDAAARLDQHVYLTSRDRLGRLDLTGMTLAVGVEIPISSSVDAARVGFAVRLHDLFGDAFRLHYATRFEGGTTLTIPFDLRTRLVLGVFGSASDFIDLSPPDALISSQNRDRLGQRASLSFVHEGSWFEVRTEALFLRDSARGEAFDSRGGALSARVDAFVEGGLVIHTGLAAELRRFGPVGDPVILGSAATRTELRLVAELGAYVPLGEHLGLIIEDTWIDRSATALHGYTENVVSFGAESRW